MSGADEIDRIGDWVITRWSYDGAQVEAYRDKPGRRVDLSNDGESIELEWVESCDDGYGMTSRKVSVPIAVLRRVLG